MSRYCAEVMRDYRLTSEQASTLQSVTRVFAYVEEFSCTPVSGNIIFTINYSHLRLKTLC